MEQANALSRFGVFILSFLWLFTVSATGSYHSIARVFSRATQFEHANLPMLSLRGGVEGKEGNTLPFGGPNPKDEFDTSDEDTAAQPKSDTIYVPVDVKSVPEAVEVSSVCGLEEI